MTRNDEVIRLLRYVRIIWVAECYEECRRRCVNMCCGVDDPFEYARCVDVCYDECMADCINNFVKRGQHA